MAPVTLNTERQTSIRHVRGTTATITASLMCTASRPRYQNNPSIYRAP
jgi:hypothetical protein